LHFNYLLSNYPLSGYSSGLITNPLSSFGDSLSGSKGLAAGAGLATLAPLAVKGGRRLMGGGNGKGHGK